jgi:hypothetical protein
MGGRRILGEFHRWLGTSVSSVSLVGGVLCALSGSWNRYEMLSTRLAILTSMMAFVPRSKRPWMAMSPRSWVVV